MIDITPPPAAETESSRPSPAALAAIDKLTRIDPDFAAITDQAGPLSWRRRAQGFPGLLQAIVAQMISNQAAAAIWGRLRAIPGALDPQTLMALSDDTLRAAGLSRRKFCTRGHWLRPFWMAP